MRREPVKVSIAVVFACFLCAANADPGVRADEMSERCGKLVEKLFKERWTTGKTDDGKMRGRFESHYNAKLNKCFLLEIVTLVTGDRATNKAALIEIQALWDANEKRQYGWFKEYDSPGAIQSNCYVQNTACRSKEEWVNLIKPYMEE